MRSTTPSTTPTFSASQFARLTGVTVRALHHYDRVGLLKPARTTTGYRAYSAADLHTLEQIVVLKFIGLSLRQIAAVRRAGGIDLANHLAAQRATLRRKRQLLDDAIAAIGELEQAALSGRGIEPPLIKRIIEVIAMQDDAQAWTKQYTDLVSAKTARLQSLAPEALATLRRDWQALLAEIRDAMTEDPAGQRAQELGRRWEQLLGSLMGQPVPPETLERHHRVQEWTPAMASFVDKPVWDFMSRVLSSRR